VESGGTNLRDRCEVIMVGVAPYLELAAMRLWFVPWLDCEELFQTIDRDLLIATAAVIQSVNEFENSLVLGFNTIWVDIVLRGT
jgi:hypothetical protein